METPLTPLEFARRTRWLHGHREGVVDGELRLTYEQFFDRCDRWSAALQQLGVARGDRVATIAPNTHAQLESFYAVPQIGAVLVPVNYRLTPEDFIYIVNHSGSSVVCVDQEYLDAVDSIRDRLPQVRHFVTFGGARDGWLDYEAAIAAASPDFTPADVDERDLLTINYTSGTTARPKGVMISHRNATMNSIGTLLHLPIPVGEPYLWTLPMFHANGWTFTWTVTAAAATHVCLRKVEPAEVFRLIREEGVRRLSAAPTVLISLANAPADVRGEVPPGVVVITAGAPPAAATIERLEGDFGWDVTQVYGLTETSPFITICAPLPEHEDLKPAERAEIKSRQGVELLTSGELQVQGDDGRVVPADGQALGEIVVRGNVVMSGYYHDPEATRRSRKLRSWACGASGGGDPAGLRRAARWPERDGGRDHRVRPRPSGALQGPARSDVRHRTAEDGHGEDPEVRPPRRCPEPSPPVAQPAPRRRETLAARDPRRRTSAAAPRRREPSACPGPGRARNCGRATPSARPPYPRCPGTVPGRFRSAAAGSAPPADRRSHGPAVTPQ